MPGAERCTSEGRVGVLGWLGPGRRTQPAIATEMYFIGSQKAYQERPRTEGGAREGGWLADFS